MANPLYEALSKNSDQNNNSPASIFSDFPKFMNTMRGQNPTQILNQLVSSGRVSQQQLDQAQKMAKQISGQMEQFKSMFGFR